MVEHYEEIRRKRLVEGLSQRAVALELGYARGTAAKAIEHPIPPGYRQTTPRAKPIIDPVSPIIEAWLEDDLRRPAKQRHSATRVHERLCEEHGFQGSASAVRRYIQASRQHSREVFMPLQFDPGEEGQVDWHDGWLIENGVERKAQFFCMRLCYSKASFVRAYERANLESFLDGHVRAFEYFGGIPKRLAYDNLKSAVITVGRGNEKGDVENLAKRSRRTYLTPVPEVRSLDELSVKLLEACRQDLQLPAARPHHEKTRRELFEQEQRCFLPLPAQRFEACREISTFADKRSLVQVQTNSYSVPVRWAHHSALIKAFVDRIEIWGEQQRVAVHRRSYATGHYILEPAHYLKLLEIKPGSLDNARAFKGQPWGEEFTILRRELEYRYGEQGTRKYINVLLLFAQYPEQEVNEAVKVCVRRRAFSDEAVLSLLRNEPPRPPGRLDLSSRPELHNIGDGIRPLSIYDQLRSGEEVAA